MEFVPGMMVPANVERGDTQRENAAEGGIFGAAPALSRGLQDGVRDVQVGIQHVEPQEGTQGGQDREDSRPEAQPRRKASLARLPQEEGSERLGTGQKGEQEQNSRRRAGRGLQLEDVRGHQEGDEGNHRKDPQGGEGRATGTPHYGEAEGACGCAQTGQLSRGTANTWESSRSWQSKGAPVVSTSPRGL